MHRQIIKIHTKMTLIEINKIIIIRIMIDKFNKIIVFNMQETQIICQNLM